MIHVRSHESDTSPVDLGSYSSRVTFMNANAAIRAALDIARNSSMRLGKCWAITLMFSFSTIVESTTSTTSRWRILPRSTPQGTRGQGFTDFEGAYRSPPMGGVHKGAAAGLAPAYSFSAYVAEVDVDVETGLVSCTNVWAAHDCGKALNPSRSRDKSSVLVTWDSVKSFRKDGVRTDRAFAESKSPRIQNPVRS